MRDLIIKHRDRTQCAQTKTGLILAIYDTFNNYIVYFIFPLKTCDFALAKWHIQLNICVFRFYECQKCVISCIAFVHEILFACEEKIKFIGDN